MPNLRSIRLQLTPKLSQMNLASLLSDNPALISLQIQLSPDLIEQPDSEGVVKGNVLRHQLQDKLPKRLRSITLEGENIDNLHPAAFKVMP